MCRRQLLEEINEIRPTNKTIGKEASALWDSLFKPIGGLGLLETLIIQIAEITETTLVDIRKKAIVVMCSDNGVVAEGVSQTDHQITAMVTENMALGKSSVCRMASVSGADVIPVDVGVATKVEVDGLLVHKIANGTKNFRREPAMTREEAIEAIQVGIDVVYELKKKGYQLLGTGEMGIGNTTTSSAIAAVLLGVEPGVVTGKGAGLSLEGIERKRKVIEEAIALHRPDATDPIDVLAKLGGFDIAGLVGVCLGAAMYRLPVVLDGVIASVAALIATRLQPLTREYLIASHMGKEPASKLLLNELGLKPIIYGELALGEGTGVALLLPMLDMAMKVYEMNTHFTDYKVKAYERYEERQ